MAEPDNTSDDIAAARRCLGIYGGDLSRWPADARAQWGAVAMGDALETERAEEEALDALLSAQAIPTTPHDLKNRIDAHYRPSTENRSSVSLWAGLSSLSGWLKPLPAGALASLSALGFAAGAVVDANDNLTPEYEAYAYLEEGGLDAFDDDAEALWDVE